MKLHLGCGNDIREGWINIDCGDHSNAPNYIKWDLANGLPPQCQDVTLIYHCHMLEHLMHSDAVKLLRSCHERLVPGGKIISAIPDLYKLCKNYVEKNYAFFEHSRSEMPNGILAEIMNFSFYQYSPSIADTHKTMYDSEYAIFTHKLAGFSDVTEVSFNPEYGDHGRADYTMYIQAVK